MSRLFSYARLDAAALYARASVPHIDRLQLYDQAADVLAQTGDVFEAVSIDPTSGFRHLVVYFDSDREGVALSIGQVLKRRFKQLRVDTLFPANRSVAKVGGTWPAPLPLLCPQVACLRLWNTAPSCDAFPFPSSLFVAQELLGPATATATAVMQLHAPGVRVASFLAGNHNYAATGACTVTFQGAIAEVPRGKAAPTTAGPAHKVLTPLTVAAAADGFAPQDVSVNVDPGTCDLLAENLAVAGGTLASLWVGARLFFNPGM